MLGGFLIDSYYPSITQFLDTRPSSRSKLQPLDTRPFCSKNLVFGTQLSSHSKHLPLGILLLGTLPSSRSTL